MGEGIKTMSTGAMNPELELSGKVKTPEEEPVVAVELVVKLVALRHHKGEWRAVDGGKFDLVHLRTQLENRFGGKWRPSKLYPGIWIREGEQ
jgi:hypothetical protein